MKEKEHKIKITKVEISIVDDDEKPCRKPGKAKTSNLSMYEQILAAVGGICLITTIVCVLCIPFAFKMGHMHAYMMFSMIGGGSFALALIMSLLIMASQDKRTPGCPYHHPSYPPPGFFQQGN